MATKEHPEERIEVVTELKDLYCLLILFPFCLGTQLIPTTTAFGHRSLGLTSSECFPLETAGRSELPCSLVSGFSGCDTMLAPFSTHVLRNS